VPREAEGRHHVTVLAASADADAVRARHGREARP
jgi:hypothetical protein